MLLCIGLPQALSVPELPSSADCSCRNDHGSNLPPRLLRRRSLLGEKQWLPFTDLFQIFCLIGDAETGITSLSVKRKLGVN
jgi:hypothetical protein